MKIVSFGGWVGCEKGDITSSHDLLSTCYVPGLYLDFATLYLLYSVK